MQISRRSWLEFLAVCLMTVTFAASLAGCGVSPPAEGTDVAVISDNTTTGYEVFGWVLYTPGGAAITGATVQLSGASYSKSATTDGYGKFKFTSVPNGTYTLTTSKAGHSFDPASKTITVNNWSVSELIIDGKYGYSISGTFSLTDGSGLLGGEAYLYTADGTYLQTSWMGYSNVYYFYGLQNGNYKVVAWCVSSVQQVVFTPNTLYTTINNANVNGVNFVGSWQVF